MRAPDDDAGTLDEKARFAANKHCHGALAREVAARRCRGSLLKPTFPAETNVSCKHSCESATEQGPHALDEACVSSVPMSARRVLTSRRHCAIVPASYDGPAATVRSMCSSTSEYAGTSYGST